MLRKIGTDVPVVASLVGRRVAEFAEMTDMLDGLVSAFEINLSCPNARGFDVGNDARLTYDIVRSVRRRTDKPVFAKVFYHHVAAGKSGAVGQAARAGCDAITAINAVPAAAIGPDGAPVFGCDAGGLSGPPIRPVALRAVLAVRNMYPDAPVIGCGGITTASDARQFLQAGACAVQVGSHAMANGVAVLGGIARGLGYDTAAAASAPP